MRLTSFSAVLAAALALHAAPARAITVFFVDFIADGSRTSFNGFETYPATTSGAPTHTEDGIQVSQISGQGNEIWSTCAFCFGGVLEGARAWYPGGGDFGYTQITLVGGIDFTDVGLLTGSGWVGPITTSYELWNDGTLVLSGQYESLGQTAGYLGFAGGGFDEIRLRDSESRTATFLDNNINALALDSIELAGNPIPEPTTLALLGAGLVAVCARRRRTS
jgi:hypothetical protein